MNWKDETSWSKSDDAEARKSPRTWVARTSDVVLIVTRRHGMPADSWFLSAEPFFRLVEVKGEAEEAKRKCEVRLMAGVERLRREVSP